MPLTRYFDAFKSGKDSLEASYFLSAAITSYNKVLELNPSNLNAKTDLGILYCKEQETHERYYAASRSGNRRPET